MKVLVACGSDGRTMGEYKMKVLNGDKIGKGLREGEALLIRKEICMVLEKRDMEFLQRAVERELRHEIKIDKEINPLLRWFINGEEIK